MQETNQVDGALQVHYIYFMVSLPNNSTGNWLVSPFCCNDN